MADIVDKKTRSRMMANIKAKDTKPELALRRALHARAFRYKLHVRNLPGQPDLVFPKYNVALFVHGCFWHRHEGCRYTTTPSTRTEFWQSKFDANVARDREILDKLLMAGWRVATVWECRLRKREQIEEATDLLSSWLLGGERQINIG